jgi:hypothetical protein
MGGNIPTAAIAEPVAPAIAGRKDGFATGRVVPGDMATRDLRGSIVRPDAKPNAETVRKDTPRLQDLNQHDEDCERRGAVRRQSVALTDTERG